MSRLRRENRYPDEVTNAVTATYRTLLRESEELLSAEQLTGPQFQALRCVAGKGATPMKAISDKMFVTPANITGIIDRLESKGLVKRKARHGDRRTIIIELTPRGAALHERVASKYGEFMRSALKGFTNEEKKTLSHLLTKLQEGMSPSGG